MKIEKKSNNKSHPFRNNSRIGIQYMMMSKPGGASVLDIMEETKCSANRVRSGVSEIRKRVGSKSVITYSNLEDTKLTRYEITNTNEIEDETYFIYDEISHISDIKTYLKPLMGSAFSEIFHEGSKAIVCLNTDNKYINRHKENDQCIKTLKDVALALDLAQRLVSSEGNIETQFAIEKFQSEFSRQLQKLSKVY